jgi:hypothetical protein
MTVASPAKVGGRWQTPVAVADTSVEAGDSQTGGPELIAVMT